MKMRFTKVTVGTIKPDKLEISASLLRTKVGRIRFYNIPEDTTLVDVNIMSSGFILASRYSLSGDKDGFTSLRLPIGKIDNIQVYIGSVLSISNEFNIDVNLAVVQEVEDTDNEENK